MLEQYLYIYYNYQQNNWSDLLLLTESVYNNTPSATTSVSVFFTNKDYHLSITIYLERDIALSYAHEFVIDFNKLQDALKLEILQQYQQLANVHRIPGPNFWVKLQIFIKAQFFYTT